jgi:hypothetical protein
MLHLEPVRRMGLAVGVVVGGRIEVHARTQWIDGKPIGKRS